MTFDFKAWMNAVWMTLIEPAQMAGTMLSLRIDPRALWMALALISVLNVLFLAIMQVISPVPLAFREETIALSPFALTALIGLSLFVLVYAVHYVGRSLGGQGDLHGALTLLVWFHAVNLTLEAGQIILVLFSPYLSAIFSLLIVGALLWCIVNFINVLHGFGSLIKSAVALAMSLLAMGLVAGLIMGLLGVTPGGTT